jgi:hypothetical protein
MILGADWPTITPAQYDELLLILDEVADTRRADGAAERILAALHIRRRTVADAIAHSLEDHMPENIPYTADQGEIDARTNQIDHHITHLGTISGGGQALVNLRDRLEQAIRLAEFPRLTVEPDGDGGDVLHCPVCDEDITRGTIRAVDSAERSSRMVALESKEEKIFFASGNDFAFADTLYYQHDALYPHAVALPAGYTEAWA